MSRLVVVEQYSDTALDGSPSPALEQHLSLVGCARAYRGDDGCWYRADTVEPRYATVVRTAVVRLGVVSDVTASSTKGAL